MLSRLGKYELRRELGKGAMGVVYEGYDPVIQRAAAIKTIQKSLLNQAEAEEIVGRFRREAQAAGRLHHPNIVSVYEYGEDGEMSFIAMEYVAGKPLGDHAGNLSRYSLADAAGITLQLLDALEYSHQSGVIHRDIKPSNIMITPDGKIKITDFGIAQVESSDFTRAGTILGTPSYMSPEQFMGLPADRRSDLYSVGVTLYQLLTGVRPFTGSNANMLMHNVLNQKPALPSSINPQVPRVLDEIVMKALSKRAENRFQTAAAFRTALKFAADMLAESGKALRPDATLKDGEDLLKTEVVRAKPRTVLEFDMAEIAKNLSAFPKPAPIANEEEPQAPVVDLPHYEIPEEKPPSVSQAAAVPKAAPPQDLVSESGLLAELAQDSKKILAEHESAENLKRQKDRRVHEALDAIVKFFKRFNEHVNKMAPEIKRTYALDARTSYSGLKWKQATIDARRQGLSESALLSNAMFSLTLCAPGPVTVKRPWDQFDALQRELQHLQLSALDNLDDMKRNKRQEWLVAQLAPELPVQISFLGNYEQYCIDVKARNLESFGVAAFRIEAEEVTPKLLDEIGLFLLGRANKLPDAMRRVR